MGVSGERQGSIWGAFRERLGRKYPIFLVHTHTVMLVRCRGLCMEDVWNFWEAFEERLGSVWGKIGTKYSHLSRTLRLTRNDLLGVVQGCL